MELKSRFFR